MSIFYRHKAKAITMGIFCMVFIFGYRIIGLYELNKTEHLVRYDERFHNPSHSHLKDIKNEDLLLPVLTDTSNANLNKNNNNDNININAQENALKSKLQKESLFGKQKHNNVNDKFSGVDPIIKIEEQSLIEKLNNKIVPKASLNDPDNFLANLQRIVHIDLKGAPPKSSYFEKFIPFLKQNGAHGILLEYEEMFPFEGELKEARHGLAYTLKDVELIKNLAKQNDLYIIPLVQTYGHLEWLLKVKKFAHLREHPDFPQVITPCLEESYTVIYGKLYAYSHFDIETRNLKKICLVNRHAGPGDCSIPGCALFSHRL